MTEMIQPTRRSSLHSKSVGLQVEGEGPTSVQGQ